MSDLASTPVKFKNYVYFERTQNGIVFSSGVHTFELKPSALYPLVVKVISAIDNGVPISTLRAQAPTNIQAAIDYIFSQLVEHNMVLERAFLDHVTQAFDGRATSHDLITYISENSPGYSNEHLQAWLSIEAQVVGHGEVACSLVKGLAGFGFERVCLYWQKDNTAHVQELEEWLRHSEFGNRIEIYRTDLRQINIDRVLEDKHVFLASDNFDEEHELVEFATALLPLVKTLQIAGVHRGRGLVSPTAGIDQASHVDVFQRLNCVPNDIVAAQNTEYFPGYARSVVGSISCLNFLNQFFGQQYTRESMILVDRECSVSYHYIPPRPGGEHYSLPDNLPGREISMPEDRELDSFEVANVYLQPLFDSHMGLFSRDNLEHIPQVPFSVDCIDILVMSYAAKPARVLGWGLSAAQAGKRCILNALKTLLIHYYGFDPRTTIGYSEAQWRERAHLEAQIRTDDSATTRRALRLPLSALSCAEFSSFESIIQTHSARVCELRALQPSGIFQACIDLDGQMIVGEASHDVTTSIRDALGELYLSRLNVYQPCADRVLLSPDQEPLSCENFEALREWAAAITASENTNALTFNECRLKSFLLDSRFVIGYCDVLTR